MHPSKSWTAVVFFAGAVTGLAVSNLDALGLGAARAATPSASQPGVTGIGGIFFKAKDPAKLQDWYVANLGFHASEYGVQFEWREKGSRRTVGSTTWGVFPETTTYFDPTTAPFMINYRVSDLDAVLGRLRAAGATVDEKVQDEGYGRFGWAIDPEGNRFELWEPR